MLLDVLVFLSGSLVVLTKYMDCITTARALRVIEQERNPLARKLMRRIGVKTTIWGIFILTIFLVVLATYILYSERPSNLYKLAFIGAALVVSSAQAAVAHSNATGRLNMFTRFLLRRWNVPQE